jgi:hypothetical protein
MNKSSFTALGLTLAVALSTGAVLVRHPSPAGQAPGAYSDILIVEDDSQRAAPAGEKAAVPTDAPQASSPGSEKTSGATSEEEGSHGDTSKGIPPRNP